MFAFAAIVTSVAWASFFSAWSIHQLRPLIASEPDRQISFLLYAGTLSETVVVLKALPTAIAILAAAGLLRDWSQNRCPSILFVAACATASLLISVIGQATIHSSFVECPDHQIGRIAFAFVSVVVAGCGVAVQRTQTPDLVFSARAAIGFILTASGTLGAAAAFLLPVREQILVSALVYSVAAVLCLVLLVLSWAIQND